MRLLVFGMGYTGEAIAREAAASGHEVVATCRDPAGAASPPGVPIVSFDQAGPAVARATHVVSTVPPSPEVDPVLRAWGAALAAAPALRWLGYLSTTGVYGDRGGAWVDEGAAPTPGQERSVRRLEAEQAWRALAGGRIRLDLFRTAGIYGPGRSPLDDLRAGRARRVGKPGHAFGRIHRDDIAGAVLAAAMQDRPAEARVLHLSDGEPAETAAVIAEAARLLGIAAPPIVPFEAVCASMSEMARSFWTENRRMDSRLTQEWLGRGWRYPSYREGLAAILREEG